MDISEHPFNAHSWQGSNPGHVCNCIGCCPDCGHCRTDPRHPKICKELQQINEMKVKLFERASL